MINFFVQVIRDWYQIIFHAIVLKTLLCVKLLRCGLEFGNSLRRNPLPLHADQICISAEQFGLIHERVLTIWKVRDVQSDFSLFSCLQLLCLGVCWGNERDLVWKRAIDRFTIFPWKVLWQKVEKRLTAWQESKKSGFGADISKDWNNASLRMFEFYYHLIKFLRKWMRFNWKHCVTISSSKLEWKLPIFLFHSMLLFLPLKCNHFPR